MAATGELIRLMNYVDDIATTLRRISASVPGMEADERKRLSETMKSVSAQFSKVVEQLDKGN